MNEKPLLVDSTWLRKERQLEMLRQLFPNRPVYVSAISHAERVRQLAKKFGEEYSQLAVAERLAIYTIQVLPFEKDDAYYYGEMLAPIPDAEWSPPGRQWKPEHGEKARFADYAIAAHAGQRDYILVSDDHLMQQPRKDLPLHPKAVGSAGIADV